MNQDDASILVRRRLAQVLFFVLALWLTHRGLAALAAADLGQVARGYTDPELLAAGGDLALELVLTREHELLDALTKGGLVLVSGRALVWIAQFFVDRMAFELAWTSPGAGPYRGPRPLHTALSLPLVVVISLGSAAFLALLLFALARASRFLRHHEPSQAGWALGALALALSVTWVLAQVWLDLWRLALAGARERPLAAASAAGRAFRRAWGRLFCARALLALVSVGATFLGFLLLRAQTQSSEEGRVWATLAIELGLLGALCLRAAWLCWAAAHFSLPETNRASSADAAPSAAPGEPLDPSPNPDASHA